MLGALHHHLRSQNPVEQRFIAFAHSASPYISAYKWSDASGFGTKYDNPASLPAASVTSIAWNPVTKSLAVCHATSPHLEAWQFGRFGFVSKHSAPATIPPRAVTDLAFSPDGAWLLVGLNSTGAYQVMAYPWSAAGFGVSPFTLNLGGNVSTILSVCWHPSGEAIGVGAVSNSGGATMFTAPFDPSTGFGSQYANPASVPTTNIRTVNFSRSGGHFIGADNGSDLLVAWPFDLSTGNGTRFTASTSNGSYGAITDLDDSHVVSLDFITSGDLAPWPLNPTSFGAKGTTVSPGLGVGGVSIDFSVDGGAVASRFTNSPYVKAYAWTGSAFGAAYSAPGTTPPAITDLVFGKST